uniref:GATA-type domain-containing protein n=1 Tax=Oryza brachyantha TaxID=4533 RepID=J3LUF8_ORYBR
MDSSVEKGSESIDPGERTASGEPKACTDCHTTKTPLWRGGPSGPKVRSDPLLPLRFSICAFSPALSVADPSDLFFFSFDPVAVQRLRDPVPEEEAGGAGAGRRRGRRGAAGEEEVQEGEGGGGDRGPPHGRVRQGGGAEAAAADAAEETPRGGGESGHPPHGPLLRRHLRLSHHLPTRSNSKREKESKKPRRKGSFDMGAMEE